jgi:hypothetical protein
MKTLQALFIALVLTAIATGASAQSNLAYAPASDVADQSSLSGNADLINVSINRVYPDPVISNLFIDVTSATETGAVLRLVDMLGRTQLQKQVMLVNGANHVEINLDGIANGGYQLLLQTNTQNIVYRLVKTR